MLERLYPFFPAFLGLLGTLLVAIAAFWRREFKPDADEPKLWFTSIESLARVLSDKNRALLDLIIEPNRNPLPSWKHCPDAPNQTCRAR
jgi:hypothetical protein